MTGTILNVAGILIGGALGLSRRQPLSASQESFFKVTLGAFTVWYGLRLTWLNLNGPFLQIIKQVFIVLLALMVGKLAGRLLRLQQYSNRLGHAARARIQLAAQSGANRAGEGFKTCATLFCAAPLGILGSVQDGLDGYFYPLAVKAVMDGLATWGFVSIFGGGVLLSALPVLALQGTLTLACAEFLKPFLEAHNLVEPLSAANGLLVFSVALVVLELKKIELAEYLPSLFFAPLIARIFQ